MSAVEDGGIHQMLDPNNGAAVAVPEGVQQGATHLV